jgi:uncharacterized protein YhaN
MRLRTLNLERYGPFTDRNINLSPDAKLHTVEGLGMSTGVRDQFYLALRLAYLAAIRQPR